MKESAVGACKSSIEHVPLRAKPPLVFHDAVFYYPADSTADDDEGRRGASHAVSEGRVPAATATACCSSDDQLPLKEAISMQPALGDDMPLIGGSAASRRRPSMLRRMRAFFGRSSSSSTGDAGEDEMSRAGRQYSAVDASMTTPPAVRNQLDEASPEPAAAAGVAAEEAGAARPARSCPSPPTCFFDGGESKAKVGAALGTDNLGASASSLMTEAAAGEQPSDVKNNSDDQLMYPCTLTVAASKP